MEKRNQLKKLNLSNSKDDGGIVIDNNDADRFGDENHDPYDISGDNIDVSIEQFTGAIDNNESVLSEININKRI